MAVSPGSSDAGASFPSPQPPAELISTLLVDSDPDRLKQRAAFCTALGHEVTVAATMPTALMALRRRKLSLLLLEEGLLGSQAAEFFAAVLAEEPLIAILVLGPRDDAGTARDLLHLGAADYLVEAVELNQLERAMATALQQRRNRLEESRTQEWLKREFIWRGAALERERSSLEQISLALLETLVNALEAKESYLRGHSARIADLSALIAAELRCSDHQIEAVRTAGRLHDIGKIGVRESVLSKQGPLTVEEYEHVKTHVVIGSQILAPLTHLGEVLAMVRHHHERFDGTGYPDGLAGEDIPLGARIIGAAEVYDALTTLRPYQDKMTPEQAADRMTDLTGTVLDPEIHRALTAAVTRRKALVFLDDQIIT